MMNNRFGKRTYVNAISSELEPDPGGGGMDCESEIQGERREDVANEARNQGKNLQMEAARKKYLFQQKMNLEGSKKTFGKGNIITFLCNNAIQGIDLNYVNKILRVSGFKPEQIVSIKQNDFRLNQVEALFKKVEDKLKKLNYSKQC